MREWLKKRKRVLEKILFKVLCIFPLDEYKVIFESEGDLSDNSYALYDYLINNGYKDNYRLIWLTEPGYRPTEIESVPKWVHGISIRRLFILATSKYIIFDHNYVLIDYKKRKGQYVVNLCHGTPFKAPKHINDSLREETDLLCSPSDFWIEHTANFYSGKIANVVVTGYPRNDYLMVKPTEDAENFIKKSGWKGSKIVFWMPTYRMSNSKDLTEDYFLSKTGLPILTDEKDLEKFDAFLKSLGVILVFKVHHLQSDYDCFKKQYSNIAILKDDAIREAGIQLYQIVAKADALITDYSSISNDFILLDRPMIFTMDDYDEYLSSRGFSFENPAQFFAGYHVINKEQLCMAIKEVATGIDHYKESRRKVKPILNKYADGNNCKRVVERIGLRYGK